MHWLDTLTLEAPTNHLYPEVNATGRIVWKSEGTMADTVGILPRMQFRSLMRSAQSDLKGIHMALKLGRRSTFAQNTWELTLGNYGKTRY